MNKSDYEALPDILENKKTKPQMPSRQKVVEIEEIGEHIGSFLNTADKKNVRVVNYRTADLSNFPCTKQYLAPSCRFFGPECFKDACDIARSEESSCDVLCGPCHWFSSIPLCTCCGIVGCMLNPVVNIPLGVITLCYDARLYYKKDGLPESRTNGPDLQRMT